MVDKVRVIGFDPSISNFGIAIAEVDLNTIQIDVQEIHLIETCHIKNKDIYKTSNDILKAAHIHKALAPLVQTVDVCMTEIPTGSQSAKAGWYFGMVVGVLSQYSLNNTLIEMLPHHVKNVTGMKNPSKREMIDWAYAQYPYLNWFWHGKRLQNKNEHMADAIAVIHAGIETVKFMDAVKGLENEKISSA